MCDGNRRRRRQARVGTPEPEGRLCHGERSENTRFSWSRRGADPLEIDERGAVMAAAKFVLDGLHPDTKRMLVGENPDALQMRSLFLRIYGYIKGVITNARSFTAPYDSKDREQLYQSIRDAYKKTPPVPLFELRSQPAFTNPNNLRQVSILLRVYESEPSAYPNMCIMHYAGEKRIPDNVPQQHITKLQNKQISEAIEAYRRLPHVGQGAH